jgi:hypothetical protein
MRIRAVGTAVCTCANCQHLLIIRLQPLLILNLGACNVLISQVSPIGMARLQYRMRTFCL